MKVKGDYLVKSPWNINKTMFNSRIGIYFYTLVEIWLYSKCLKSKAHQVSRSKRVFNIFLSYVNKCV